MKKGGTWKASGKRPEDRATSESFYGTAEGDAHRERNAIRSIQRKLTMRALELLAVAPPARLLDAGCGSGFSTEVAKEVGFDVAGFDADPKMVAAARAKGIDARMGNLTDIPFEKNSFDAAMSISALQWLGAGTTGREAGGAYARCAREFFRVLAPQSRAAVQWYPRDEAEALLAGKAFGTAGFAVTLHIDSADNPKKRKVYLVLAKK